MLQFGESSIFVELGRLVEEINNAEEEKSETCRNGSDATDEGYEADGYA